MDDNPRDALGLQLERWRMRAARAQARRAGHDTATLDEAIAEHESTISKPDERHERMRGLEARLALDPVDVDLAWWVVACTLDPELVRAAEAIRPRRSSLASFVDAADLDPDTARELAFRFAANHPLITTGLVRATDDDSPASSALAPSPRFVAWLLGDDAPGDGVELVEVTLDDRARLMFDVVQLRAIAKLTDLTVPWSRVMVLLDGPPRTGRRTAIAFAAKRAVVSVDFDGLAASQVAPALRALRRELALVDAVPVLANVSSDRDALLAVRRFIDDQAGPVVVTTAISAPNLQVSRPVVRVAWKVPDTAVRRALWLRALHDRDLGAELDEIALRYRLGPGGIARAVASARATSSGMLATSLSASDLVAGVRHNIAEGMAGLATQVEVTQTWDDVVLADDTRDQVQVLVSRLRHAHLVLEKWGYRAKLARGTGVAALFSGPPGTGKTMCAGLIARELDLELYQVDLSQVVSKWVGETEKQLARVFDGAEAGHALLLFDEADALFGQRSTETRGAVDRYANLEVNFLLQRIETFGGITILTTNLDAAIDKALKRRLAGHIVFGPPDDEERADLWRRLSHTASSPLEDDLDFEELAHTFAAMTGANIRNAAIAAAFYAARDESPTIGQAHLLRAGRAEYRSMGHILAERSRPAPRRGTLE